MQVSTMMSILRDRMVDNIHEEDTSDSVLLQWLGQGYLRIQRLSQYWSFLHNRGEIFSSVASTSTYSLPLIRTIDQRTTYSTSDGGSDRIILCKGSYRFWVAEERYSAITASRPVQLIEAPNDKWILYPTPDAIYDIYGDYWSQPDTFSGKTSEPVWADDLHDLVWLVTLGTCIPRAYEKHFAESAIAEANANIPSVLLELQRRYLSGFKGMI